MKQKKLLWGALSVLPLKWNKKKTAIVIVGILIFSFIVETKTMHMALASGLGTVVINEIAWAGSTDSSSDEWIELYNTSSQNVDLTNWFIDDDHGASKYVIQSGTIPANGYFLIEDHESTVSSVTADAIIDLSLANSGDSLELYNVNGQLVDGVNTPGVAWAAGSNTTKASMEKIDPFVSGDTASNWATSTGSGAKSSGGSNILGTPKKTNSASTQQPQGPNVVLALSSVNPNIGDVLSITVKVNSISNLFAYGFDLTYDPKLLHFKSAAAQSFLSANGSIPTSFQAALENNTAGKLVVAQAATGTNKTGVNGSGDLALIQFDVLAASQNQSNLQFGANSFLANASGDVSAQFIDQSYTVQAQTQIDPVNNLQISENAQRYSLSLSWDASANATSYKVYREDPHGQMVLLQSGTALNFTDKDGVSGGGNIIPGYSYKYEVVALNGTNASVAVQGSQKETRGLKGDNNRNDRVDGRDLEQLAKHFAETDTDPNFSPLTDTTYDGTVNGSDLIDIGANFALTYP